MNNKKIITNLVFSGGGVNGIAHIGALFALKELECLDKVEVLVGTSVGSLVMSLYAIGYEHWELYDFIKLFDLSKLKNLSIQNISLLGLDTGTNIEFVIKKLIKGKGYQEDIKLKELYEIKKKKIVFTAVCINTMELCHISHETHPNLPLFLAIRMSTSLPFIYCPVTYEGNMYIDGGCLDNFPISMFKNDKNNTIGLLLSGEKNVIKKIDHLETYIIRVLQCIMEGMSMHSKKGFEECTITVNIETLNLANFDISNERKDELFLKGYNAVMNNKDKL